MSKQQQHPVLFLITTSIITIVLLIIILINPILYFFVLLAIVGWNIGLRNRRKRETTPHLNTGTQKYITMIDEMMGKS